eukprot:gb/GEZN01012313.1/.p1 GENE.gb/GEZN01012313.1/~~gb/GEZN01012313.1/.p1  ORF type:complete len:100 (-),score=15.98 gb/GEZN01012313.1/:133-432(-)
MEFKDAAQKEAWKKHWSGCAADVQAKERNCLGYEFCENISDERRAIIYERYVTKSDLDGPHQETMKAFSARAGKFDDDTGLPRMTFTHYSESGVGFIRQ